MPASPRPVSPRRWPRVVFLDWAGTMSHSLFWSRWHEADPARRQRVQRDLFGDEALVHDWMRGRLSAEDVVAVVCRGDDPALWLTELERSCREMALADDRLRLLVPALRSTGVRVVIATDNMDTFARWTVPALGLVQLVDDVLDSWRLGCLKDDRDRAGRSPFFHPWLEREKIDPADAVLFDDGGHDALELHISWVPVTPERPLAAGLARLLTQLGADWT